MIMLYRVDLDMIEIRTHNTSGDCILDSCKSNYHKTTDLSQVTDKLYHITLYTSPWSRFKLTSVVIYRWDDLWYVRYLIQVRWSLMCQVFNTGEMISDVSGILYRWDNICYARYFIQVRWYLMWQVFNTGEMISGVSGILYRWDDLWCQVFYTGEMISDVAGILYRRDDL